MSTVMLFLLIIARIFSSMDTNIYTDGMPSIPAWDAESHTKMMKERNITRSVLRVTSQGTFLNSKDITKSRTITRETNEHLASIYKAHPSQFSFFASLPLPLILETILEIDYALDNLGAVGFVTMSDMEGLYLGDPIFAPVLDKLNARKSIIFIYFTTCNLIIPSTPTPPSPSTTLPVKVLPYPRPMLEFMFDETRTVANILLSSLLHTYPDITSIMSHCNCTLPPIIDRIGAFGAVVHETEDSSPRFKELLRTGFDFDLAWKPFPDQIHGLVRMLGGKGEAGKRLVYGSGYPSTPERAVIGLMEKMDGGVEEVLGGVMKGEIYEGNARGCSSCKSYLMIQ